MAAKASAAVGGAITVPDSAETDELEAAFALTADEADAVQEVEEQALSASAPTADYGSITVQESMLAFSCEVLSWIVMIQLSQLTL